MIMEIFGGNGVGKSSLMNYFLNESAFNTERIRKGHKEIRALNEKLGLAMPEPKHLTYLNGTAVFRKRLFSPRVNILLEPKRLGIQEEAPEGIECQHILPYSTLGIDEAQTYFPSRDGSNTLQNYQFSFFEKHRHNNLDIYMSTTRAKLIDLRIRDLACGMHVKERHITRDKDNGWHITWFVNYIDVGDIDAYLEAGPKDKKYYFSKEKITCDYNIFEIYDSESQKGLFHTGYKNYELKYGIA